MIRVGIIGAGFMGRNHFNQYEKLSDHCRVVMLCDKEADRRAGDWSSVGGNVGDTQGTCRQLTDIRPCTEWTDLVSDPEVDLVDVCAPTFMHREIVVEALRQGKHVLCEKPMGLTVAECDEMLAAAASSKGKFMVAQVIRFWPEFVYLKQVFDERRFGDLKALHMRRGAATPEYTLNNWILNHALSGGAILDLHVHDVDYALSLFGRPQSVFAQGYQRTPGSVDRVHAAWDCGPERVVQIEGFWDVPKDFGFNMGYTAVFEMAALHYDMASGKPLTLLRPDADPQTPQLSSDDGYFAEIRYFVDCVRENRNPAISTPRESRDAVAVALAEKESVLSGKPVTMRVEN